jgi:hypothetical protein
MRGPQKASVPLGLKYHHMDVFSSKPLSGNGVIVFRLREALPTAVMQDQRSHPGPAAGNVGIG